MLCKFKWDHQNFGLSSISHVRQEWCLYIGKRHHHNNMLRINSSDNDNAGMCLSHGKTRNNLGGAAKEEEVWWWMNSAHVSFGDYIIIDQWLIRGSQLEEMSNDYQETNERTKPPKSHYTIIILTSAHMGPIQWRRQAHLIIGH